MAAFNGNDYVAITSPTQDVVMAGWALRCPNCNCTFTHASVEDTLANFYFPPKPTFPVDGKSIDCPHCGHSHLYQQSDLIYQAAASI